MESIRVLLINVAPLLSAFLVGAAKNHPELDVVIAGDSDTERQLREVAPHIVVCGIKDEKCVEAVLALAQAKPPPRVLLLGEARLQTSLHELKPYRAALEQLSPEELLDAILASRPSPSEAAQ